MWAINFPLIRNMITYKKSHLNWDQSQVVETMICFDADAGQLFPAELAVSVL
jgi:hypothetical protein